MKELEAIRKARKALEEVLRYAQINTCQHENTHRGGIIWEICDDCGMKWADDRGGKPEWKDPKSWTEAMETISELKELELSFETKPIPTACRCFDDVSRRLCNDKHICSKIEAQ